VREPQHHHHTASADKVPLLQKVSYGAGGANDALMGNIVHNFANPVLNMFLGVSPSLIAIALFIPRIIDAFIDPVVGHWSDNLVTRFGRRKPFLIVGGLLTALAVVLMWWLLPESGDVGIISWFIFTAFLFFLGTTFFLIPYNALGYELTPDYHERTRLMFVRSCFATAAGFLLPWIFAILQSGHWGTPLASARWLSLCLGIVFVVIAIAPVFFCREWVTESPVSHPSINLRSALTTTLSNRPFLILSGVVLAMITSYFLVDALGFYMVVYYVYGGDATAGSLLIGTNGVANQIVGILSIPVATVLATRYGKKNVLFCLLVLAALGASLRWAVYTPSMPYAILVSTILIAPGFSAIWMLVPSMLADVCDFEELRSGHKLGGTIAAVNGWLVKLGVSCAFLLGNISLDLIGFNVKLGGGQSGETFLWMRLLFVAVPFIGFTAAAFLVLKYPLTEGRAYEIKDELARRSALQMKQEKA